ncbi:MAG: hypothetical protein WBV94_32350 [Blastocatellia bacterium]
MRKTANRSRSLALIFFCALTGIYLSSILGLMISPVRVSSAAPRHIILLARLSLTDSALVRFEKRALSSESKTFRRQMPVALLPSGNKPALPVFENEQPSAFKNERCNFLTAISPPTDRAPPGLSV